jgi:hypothetical protein
MEVQDSNMSSSRSMEAQGRCFWDGEARPAPAMVLAAAQVTYYLKMLGGQAFCMLGVE